MAGYASSLAIAQAAAASVYCTMALMHLLIWSRGARASSHLWFSFTCLAAAGVAVCETLYYRAETLDYFTEAFRWNNSFGILWALGLLWFVVTFTEADKLRVRLAGGLSGLLVAALAVNIFSTYGLLYSEITELRMLTLPWGEVIALAKGQGSYWSLLTDTILLGLLAFVVDGCIRLWRRQLGFQALFLGLSILFFALVFVTYGRLVDTGLLDLPYANTYAFLVVVLAMNQILAGEVVRSAVLSRQVAELQTAVVDERSRIAGELHDSVTQTLFSTAAIADALPEVWNRYPDKARQALEDLRLLTKGALAEMRTLLVEMRPAALLEKPLGEFLKQMADATVARTRMSIMSEVDCQCPLPDDVQIALYRVAQEALNNIIKHSQADQATLRLSCHDNAVELEIRDNGRGFEAVESSPGTMGLEIMRERVLIIGADMRVESRPGQGTVVRVSWHSNAGTKKDDGE